MIKRVLASVGVIASLAGGSWAVATARQEPPPKLATNLPAARQAYVQQQATANQLAKAQAATESDLSKLQSQIQSVQTKIAQDKAQQANLQRTLTALQTLRSQVRAPAPAVHTRTGASGGGDDGGDGSHDD